jgi:hypothetical protein
MAKKQVYLGDGLYATIEKDAFHPLILTTGHHEVHMADNVVYLEAPVLISLITAIEEEYPK